MRRPVFTLLLAAAALAPAAAHAAAPCPPSTFSVYGTPTSLNGDAVFDTTTFAGSGGWDMPAGRVHMYSTGTLGGVTTAVLDDFDVTGVPPGTVVDVLATLTVDGAVWTDGCGGSGCAGWYEVWFRHGSDSLSVKHAVSLFTGRADFHDVIQLLVRITAGQPERLSIRAHGQRSPGGAHPSEATSVLSFSGLAEGVGIVSCKGFAGNAVPVRTNSWGRLKSLYR